MLIGAGGIGSVLHSRLKELHYEVPYVVRSSGIYPNLSLESKISVREEYPKYLINVDAVCITAPPLDDGLVAYHIMKKILENRMPVVTCEKGALANFFQELEGNLDRIGYSATVGGNSGILQYAKERMNPKVEGIHAIINGTLNYILDELSQGKDLGKVVEEAKRLGYAEPGPDGPLDVINKETSHDVAMKIAILFNTLDLGRIKASDINTVKIDEQDLKILVSEAKNRRYIVSITRGYEKEDVIAGSVDYNNGWFISAGFKNPHKNTLFLQLEFNGINNSLLIYERKDGNRDYKISGIVSGSGAGPIPTTTAMLMDLQKLLKLEHQNAV